MFDSRRDRQREALTDAICRNAYELSEARGFTMKYIERKFGRAGGSPWRLYAEALVAALATGNADDDAPGLRMACSEMGVDRSGSSLRWYIGAPGLPGGRLPGDCVDIPREFRSIAEQRALGLADMRRAEARAQIREAKRRLAVLRKAR